MDKAGDIALGYSASSGSVFPSIRYTGRIPNDPLGTMEAETIIQPGAGSQLQNLSRWGDYSAMTVDPVDDCTFWYTSEYLKASGTWNWSTRIASFRFPGCGGAVTPDFSLSATPASQNVTAGSSTSYSVTVALANGSGSVTLSASGWPTGAGGAFSPNPTTSSSALNVTTSSTTPAGTYPITIAGTNGSATHTTTVNLVVGTSSAGTPSAPLDLTAKAGPGKGVSLSWSPPATDGGSAITGYRVYRSRTSAVTDTDLIASPGNVTTFKDTSTTRNIPYWYAVKAFNAVGDGPFSNTASATPTR